MAGQGTHKHSDDTTPAATGIEDTIQLLLEKHPCMRLVCICPQVFKEFHRNGVCLEKTRDPNKPAPTS